MTSALLQLPFSMPMREKVDRVEGIIAELVIACSPNSLCVMTPSCRGLAPARQLG